MGLAPAQTVACVPLIPVLYMVFSACTLHAAEYAGYRTQRRLNGGRARDKRLPVQAFCISPMPG